MVKTSKKTSKRTPEKTPPAGLLNRVLGDFHVAWRFFTRLPLPDGLPTNNTKLAAAASAFAPVGFVVGCAAALVLWLVASAGLPSLVAVLSGLAAAALITGALHEDGLADVADGFGGGATKTKKLEIMKDSRIGTYGVLALVFSVGIKAALLAAMVDGAGAGLAAVALIVAHTLSRAGLPMMMARMEPVRRSGLGKSAGRPEREDAFIAAAIGLLLAIFVAGPLVGYGAVLIAGLLAGLGFEAAGWLAHRQIGGVSGDVLGFAQQVTELLVLVALSVVSVLLSGAI